MVAANNGKDGNDVNKNWFGARTRYVLLILGGALCLSLLYLLSRENYLLFPKNYTCYMSSLYLREVVSIYGLNMMTTTMVQYYLAMNYHYSQMFFYSQLGMIVFK